MKPVSRKKFILSGLSLIPVPYLFTHQKEPSLNLSFSTLACPDWSFDKIIEFAVANNYSGIEVRGILRELDLTKVPEFSSPEAIAVTMKKMKDRGLVFVDLGSSCALHYPKGEERTKNLDEGKKFIDLAQQLNCPYIRVYPNEIPKDRERQETLDLISEGLRELGTYADKSNVMVLIETHKDLLYKKDILTVMEASAGPHTGLVWDICNMWSITKEPPEEVYPVLKPYIRHAHIKDLKIVDGKPQYVLLGTGIVPIFQAIDILYRNDYSGYYSFEWEKLWHPEILDPQIALADYPIAMKKHFSSLKPKA